ncbi:hypothetical protein ASPFODRAFT_44827 [Aspergillus luchuensis CBS 106.47]|uniref:Uncharacterized protein n=1 Tax=Aspergillus luchuensis (strain CBS 106.47) TaxID=1137211 RepID=A0A1M3TKE4_ASPLC|nr:hypothetical protein ASPFODRAFT_44827 [Aspergillus luchuensis CBS 106.47]
MPQNANQSLSKPQERHPAGSHRPSQAKLSHRQRHHNPNQTLPPSQAFKPPSYPSLSPPPSTRSCTTYTPHNREQTDLLHPPCLHFASSSAPNKQTNKYRMHQQPVPRTSTKSKHPLVYADTALVIELYQHQ